jgi:hypothetical protein
MKSVTCKICKLPTTRNKKHSKHPTLEECIIALGKVVADQEQILIAYGVGIRSAHSMASAVLYVANK